MLQLAQLDKQFAAKVLFYGLDWQIEAGERIGLVGANGAGKTTLLRILAGEEVADAGQVLRGNGETLAYLPQEAPRVQEGTVRGRVEGGAAEVQRLGQELERLTQALSTATGDAIKTIANDYDDVQQRYAMADGYTLEGRAEAILVGLGFAKERLDQPIRELSGGWWMRVELARLLVARPDYLLMDEPTNHLDAPSLAWLEDFLRGYAGSWVVVSHDRYFLNRCVSSIAELGHGKLTRYPGNYDAFLAAQAMSAEQAQAAADAHARKSAHLESFIDRFGAKASKAKQAQSRVKQLEKLAPPPPPPKRQKRMYMRLPTPARSGQVVAKLTAASVAFGERTVLGQVHFSIERGQKMAIVGANGAGKSTLLKAVAGIRPLDAGERALGHNVTPYYFAQHQLDMLRADATVMEEMTSVMMEASIGEVRGLLGAFLFDNDAVQRRVGALSGGEKARLALAKMLAQPANFLLLDEPTNHLDLTSREVLEQALQSYAGTVLCVSHDRYFVGQLASHIVEVPGDGSIEVFNGGYQAYRTVCAERTQTALAAATAVRTAQGGRSNRDAGKQAAKNAAKGPSEQAGFAKKPADPGTKKHGKQDFAAHKASRGAASRRLRAISDAEQEIASSERALAGIDAQLADPAVFADAGKARALMEQREALAEETLPALLGRWEALHAQEDGGAC